MFALIAVLVGVAFAGPGPWVQRSKGPSLFVGADTQRFEQFAADTGSFDKDALVEVDEGINAVILKGIVSLRLTGRADAELSVPYGYVQASREDGGLCTALGPKSCATTRGFAPISLRSKVLIVDELLGPPVSFSLGAELRYGLQTADDRARLTNLGEGTNDIGLFAGLGRSGGVGKGYYYAYLEGGARYRTPNVDASDRQDSAFDDLYGDVSVPGYEVYGETAAVIVPDKKFGIGPAVSLFSRPAGVEFSETNLGDIDRFSALSVMALSAGGKMQLGMPGKTTLNLSVFRSVYTRNNPLVTSVSVGLSLRDLGQHREG